MECIGVDLVERGDNYVIHRISAPDDTKRYFLDLSLRTEYSFHIDEVNNSILNVSAVSAVLPIAWVLGRSVCVEELDSRFLESAEEVRKVMKGWYPSLPFSGSIVVKKIEENGIAGEKTALLFSGGVDSTSSLIKHLSETPVLVMIRGADIPLHKERFWEMIYEHYSKFAREIGVKLESISTNLRASLNEWLLDYEFGRYGSGSWWGSFYHGIALLGLCAPLSVARKVKRILIASSYTSKFTLPWGSSPEIDEKIRWADIIVQHDGYELSRQEKIRYLLKPYTKERGSCPLLRVCYSQFKEFNCGKCLKCVRTMLGLLLEGIDPTKCGFPMESDFLEKVKRGFETRSIVLDDDNLFFIRDIQEHIPSDLSYLPEKSRYFFKWLRDYDLDQNYVGWKRMSESFMTRLLLVLYKHPTVIKVGRRIFRRLKGFLGY